MTDIAIFRQQLFKASETFIAQQASALSRFSPLYVGRKRFSVPPDGARSFALEDIPEQRRLLRKIWQVATRDVRPYKRLLKGHNPSLIHAHFGVDGVYALPLARALDVPLVTTFHGFDATTSSRNLLSSGKPALINYLIHRQGLARKGQLFLCVSEHIRQQVLKLGFPEERTQVHYIGVDTTSIHPVGERSRHPVILHVARLVEKKGTSDLLDAFALIHRAHPDAELQIIGEGPLGLQLRSKAQNLGIGHAVQFFGIRSHAEVLSMMGRAWVFCLPSVTSRSGDTEGLPIVLLEAAALGIPVVTTYHAGIPEAVIDGMTGTLQAEHDVAGMADSLSELLGNARLRTKMGDAARRHMENHFNLARQSALLDNIYEQHV